MSKVFSAHGVSVDGYCEHSSHFGGGRPHPTARPLATTYMHYEVVR